MNKTEKNKIAAAFLQAHLDNVTAIEKAKKGSFCMKNFVVEFDEKNNCGTVCCMEGWLPNTFPHMFRWNTNWCVSFLKEKSKNNFPIKEIERELWSYLIGLSCPEYAVRFGKLGLNSDFNTVKSSWKKVIKALKENKI